ncbi:type II toxin-antitoxin system VapC family toxin [Brevundimonas sp.]|jgi:predicted nucleic acid-binding protein|uniref:type II toxin-antitoxin system VapC family toxin n=1 Tax=Brevundimonas sp. TaxID=1871086 RepID=UPI0037843A73
MSLILADSSVWLDHLRSNDPVMDQLAVEERLLMHTYVIGELSLGNLANRPAFLSRLRQIDAIIKARDDDVFNLIETQRLSGSGIGWVDAHLLTSVVLAGDVKLWTRDRRLNAAAERLGRAAQLHH